MEGYSGHRGPFRQTLAPGEGTPVSKMEHTRAATYLTGRTRTEEDTREEAVPAIHQNQKVSLQCSSMEMLIQKSHVQLLTKNSYPNIVKKWFVIPLSRNI